MYPWCRIFSGPTDEQGDSRSWMRGLGQNYTGQALNPEIDLRGIWIEIWDNVAEKSLFLTASFGDLKNFYDMMTIWCLQISWLVVWFWQTVLCFVHCGCATPIALVLTGSKPQTIKATKEIFIKQYHCCWLNQKERIFRSWVQSFIILRTMIFSVNYDGCCGGAGMKGELRLEVKIDLTMI